MIIWNNKNDYMKYKNEYKISYNVKMNWKPEGGRETLTPYTNLHYTTVRALILHSLLQLSVLNSLLLFAFNFWTHREIVCKIIN